MSVPNCLKMPSRLWQILNFISLSIYRAIWKFALRRIQIISISGAYSCICIIYYMRWSVHWCYYQRPVYDLVLAVRMRRMRYLGHVLRLPPDRIVWRSLIALVKGGTYYPEGSLFSDCELENLQLVQELLDTAKNRSTWRAKVASLKWSPWRMRCRPTRF